MFTERYPHTDNYLGGMMTHLMRVLAVGLVLLLGMAITSAQEAEATEEPIPVPAQWVETVGGDGLTLVGEFYGVNPGAPTVVLLHELYDTRLNWRPTVRQLVGAGFNVLAVDIRGFGATGGRLYWQGAVEDMAAWFNWLRTASGVHPERIVTMGSSIGSSIAVIGCANDALCKGAVAISPGWSYYGLNLAESLPAHPILIVYAERDRWPALGVPRMVETAPANITLQTYPGNAHGMNLLEREAETITPAIIQWIAERA